MGDMTGLRAVCRQCVLSLIAAFALQGGHVWAMGHRIAGKSAEELFKAPHLAELAKAACEGDAKSIARAISAGADPNGLSVDGGTPLLWAVYCNNPQGVEALLKAGADPNYRVQGKYSPTLAAATAENPKILPTLLAHGGDPNANDGENWSALRYALSVGAKKDKWVNYYTLINAGVDINRKDSSGDTIADYAVDSVRYDKVVELLDRGYNVDLLSLGADLQTVEVPSGHPQFSWRGRVKATLEQRGIKFPIPALHGRRN